MCAFSPLEIDTSGEIANWQAPWLWRRDGREGDKGSRVVPTWWECSTNHAICVLTLIVPLPTGLSLVLCGFVFWAVSQVLSSSVFWAVKTKHGLKRGYVKKLQKSIKHYLKFRWVIILIFTGLFWAGKNERMPSISQAQKNICFQLSFPFSFPLLSLLWCPEVTLGCCACTSGCGAHKERCTGLQGTIVAHLCGANTTWTALLIIGRAWPQTYTLRAIT